MGEKPRMVTWNKIDVFIAKTVQAFLFYNLFVFARNILLCFITYQVLNTVLSSIFCCWGDVLLNI